MFCDRLTLDRASLSLTDQGYLHINARVARTGAQVYAGHELGRPELETIEVQREEAEVFARDSLESFAALPITLDHPSDPVDAENWRDLAIGTTGEEVLRDGDFIKIGLRITDAEAIKAIQGGKRELSVGYAADLEWRDGVAYQTAIRANHIAVVDKARAGEKARIGDEETQDVLPEQLDPRVLPAAYPDLSFKLEEAQAEIADLAARVTVLIGERDAALKALKAAQEAQEAAQMEAQTLQEQAVAFHPPAANAAMPANPTQVSMSSLDRPFDPVGRVAGHGFGDAQHAHARMISNLSNEWKKETLHAHS